MGKFKYFKIEEFDCQETGENDMQDEFIHRLDMLREQAGFQLDFGGIGIAKTFVHVDIRKTVPVLWTY